MKILFVGDIFGSAGRHIVHEHLPHLLETHSVDLLIINGENAAGGFGLTPAIAEELFDLGAHVITTGNHIWDKKEIFEYIDVPQASHVRGRRVLRPANYAHGTPGFGVYQGTLPNGPAYAVINLQGRVFMNSCDDPFRKADDLLTEIREKSGAKVILHLDFHAEDHQRKSRARLVSRRPRHRRARHAHAHPHCRRARAPPRHRFSRPTSACPARTIP